MSDNVKVLSISSLRQPVAGIVEIDGERYPVRKYTGLQYQRAAALSPASPVTELYGLVQEVVPALPAPALLALDREQVEAILLLANQGIAAVERLFPNALSPEPPTSPG
jgi:hypothetical protein